MKIKNLPYWVDELPQTTQHRLRRFLINEGIIGEELEEFFSEKTMSIFGTGGDLGIAIDCIILDEPYYYDSERWTYISEEELMEEYADLKSEDGTDAETFEQYLMNCLSVHGTLEKGEF